MPVLASTLHNFRIVQWSCKCFVWDVIGKLGSSKKRFWLWTRLVDAFDVWNSDKTTICSCERMIILNYISLGRRQIQFSHQCSFRSDLLALLLPTSNPSWYHDKVPKLMFRFKTSLLIPGCFAESLHSDEIHESEDTQSHSYSDVRADHDHLQVLSMPSNLKNLAKGILSDLQQKCGQALFPMMEPDTCIVNYYDTTGSLGLHQDLDESDTCC